MTKQSTTSAADPKISQDLKDTLLQHPEIQKIYFDNDGNHFFNVHQGSDGKLYSRIPKRKEYATVQGRRTIVPVEFYPGMQHLKAKYAIAISLTNDEVLKADINYTLPKFSTYKQASQNQPA